MKTRIHHHLTIVVLGLGVFLAGCASPDVNPSQPRPDTGYVDFHADEAGLCWEVSRFDERSQSFRRVYSELTPPQGEVLRLAFAPGHYRLRITFLNRVVREPALVEVDVRDGMITPVAVMLTPDSSVMVERKGESYGGTAKGRYGRRTRYSNYESTMHRISVEVNTPIPYRTKEQTSYAHQVEQSDQ